MKNVIVVGNCNYDGPRICSLVENFGVSSCDIKSIDEAIDKISKEKFDLILVNRVCVGDDRNGIELIDHIKKKKIDTPIMLITNYPESMKEAVKHGAVVGFGKKDLDDNPEKIRELLKNYLDGL